MTTTEPGATFQQLLDGLEMVVAPGAYDGITAQLIEQPGFPLVYMTGSVTTAARGFQDYGLFTMSEMVDTTAVISAATGNVCAVSLSGRRHTDFGCRRHPLLGR